MTRKFEGPIVGFSGEKIALAQAEIARLTEENEALRDRLEIIPETHLDGIDARDETIRLQEAELLSLRAEIRDADADEVNHPSHYTTGRIEAIDAIESALGPESFMGYLRGNVLKYTWRAGKKGPASTDLRKAAWYLARMDKAE